MKISLKKISFLLILLAGGMLNLQAQEAHANLDADAIKNANNPLAHIKAFNVHNYYISSFHGGVDGQTANQTMLRYAQPVGKFLLRATMPIATMSATGINPESGLGDFNMFAIYSFSKKEGTQLGVGPSIVAPTGTNDMGQGKWQAGLSALAFFSGNPQLQMGSLLQWQMSFAGDEDRDDVNLLTTQIFFIWQLGKGTYLRSTGVWSFDLEHGFYNIPIGLGIGQVVKVGKTVFNIFAEPQYSAFAYGSGQAKFQTFIGFNTQF